MGEPRDDGFSCLHLLRHIPSCGLPLSSTSYRTSCSHSNNAATILLELQETRVSLRLALTVVTDVLVCGRGQWTRERLRPQNLIRAYPRRAQAHNVRPTEVQTCSGKNLSGHLYDKFIHVTSYFNVHVLAQPHVQVILPSVLRAAILMNIPNKKHNY